MKKEEEKSGGPVQKLVRRHQFLTNSPQEFYIVFYTELSTISQGRLSSFVTYCMDEKSDHKVGIYCNLIGPLDQS